jgi:hypothetical protein
MNRHVAVSQQSPSQYNEPMKKKALSQTNPYLRDRQKRLAGLVTSVSSSSAIEGIAAHRLLGSYLNKTDVDAIPRHSAGNE